MPRKKTPIDIRGILYPSMYAAAPLLGVSVSTIFCAKKRGTLDRVGLRPLNKDVILAQLANAGPEEFLRLKVEAQKWLAFNEKKVNK